MSDINFCNTKEQLNHLGEVVTGKVDGSPTGADIDTSTLPYTGQVRKTLPAIEDEYEQSITDKEAEADAAIDSYRLLSKGPYASGIALESKFEYITYSGESYFAVNPPYTTTATLPDVDGNLFVGGYLNQSTNLSASPVTATGSTTPRTLGDRFADVVNVKDFGAVGDGVTDDTVAIQAAIDAAFNDPRKPEVIIPPSSGEYRYTEIINKGVLRGMGGVLKCSDNLVDPDIPHYTLHNFHDASSRATWYEPVEYVDLIIDGNGTNIPSEGHGTFGTWVFDAITCAGKGSSVKGCNIYDVVDSGIMFTFVTSGECSGNYIQSDGRDLGIYVNDYEAGELTDGALVKDNIITGFDHGGIGVKRGVQNITVVNNTITDCGNGITHETFGTGLGGHPSKSIISNNHMSHIGYKNRSAAVPPSETGLYLADFNNGVAIGNIIDDVSGVGIILDGIGFNVSHNTIIGSSPSNAKLPVDSRESGGIIIQTISSVAPNSYGICSSNTVTAVRDRALWVRLVDNLQVNGGSYESYDSTAVRIEPSTKGLQLTGVRAHSTNPTITEDFEFFGGSQFFVEDCVAVTNGFYPFSQSAGLDTNPEVLENKGTASTVTATGVQFAHGLTNRDGVGIVPSSVVCTPRGSEFMWVESVDGTYIVLRGANISTQDIDWIASA